MTDELVRLGLIDEDDIVLDEAALALALLDHPEVDPAPYRKVFDAIATRLGAFRHDAADPGEQADALARVLGEEFGFNGDRSTYDDPLNADLMGVVDRRVGLPVSLSILYVAAARRISWRADVLDIPGHVLVLVGAGSAAVIVDPFRGGVRVGHDQVAALLASDTGAPVRVSAMPNRAVLVRLLLNQATRAEQAGKGRRALDLYGRMTVMAPGHGHAWWERARLELVDGDIPAARQSLSAMLEITREPALRRRISDTLHALPAA